jgi:hypothetical protein
VANNMRAVTSKSYAYYIETSFVESCEEAVHDLYSTTPHAKRNTECIPVVDDLHEGWALQGARRKNADSAADAKGHFEDGLKQLSSHETDIGNVHEHTATFFTVSVFQYWPSMANMKEERVVCANLRFAHAPGAERLAMDPALLRIREGPTLNQSLITFCDAIQVCCLQECRHGTAAIGLQLSSPLGISHDVATSIILPDNDA